MLALSRTAWAQTTQDFDTPGSHFSPAQCSTPPGNLPTELPGGPTGEFLRLASAPAPNNNTIAFDRSNVGAFPLVVADFDFRITPTNGRADGLGFSILNTANYDITGPVCPPAVAEEPNFAGSVGIGFDVYQSNGPPLELNNNHVSVHFNGATLGEFDATPAADLAGGQWIHARIIFRQGGGHFDVTVILTPRGGQTVTVVDHLPLPAFAPYEGRVLLGARAGGETADHDIDNVRVQFLDASSSVLSFSNSYYVGSETGSAVIVTVDRVGNTAGTAQVQYATSDGSAVAGADYSATSGTLTWGADDASPKSFSVPLINDLVDESDEFFFVSLTNPSAGSVLGGPALATVAIVNLETRQDFDNPGSHFSTAQCSTPPGNLPTELPGGPTGTFLRLANAPAPNNNTIAFDRSSVGAFPLIVADFDFRITPTNGRADGLGFALLNTASYQIMGPVCPPAVAEEPNFAGSLGIGFDVYKSNGPPPEPNNNHVSVHFNGATLGEFDATPAADLAGGQWIHARIIFRQGSGVFDVTVILTPRGGQTVTVVDRLPLPAFTPYEGRVLLGARAGGLTADHDIDNVRVQFLDASSSVLSFSNSSYVGTETGAAVIVTVDRVGNTAGTAQVQYATSDGSAVAGSDYSATSGTLTWGPDDAAPKSFSVPLINDLVDEGDEFFSVSLTNPSAGSVVGGPALATATIVDDERSRQVGSWGPVFHTQVVAVHLHHLPDGTVMFWPGDSGEIGVEHGFDHPRIWDPATGTLESVPFPHNLFCSGHSFLADGRLFVTGGHETLAPPGPTRKGLAKAAIYDSLTRTWTSLPDMNAGRWYPTNTTLPNGDVLVASGESTGPGPGDPPAPPAVINEIPQVWDIRRNTWRTLTGAQYGWPLYPWMFVAPNGRVFHAGPNQDTGYVDTADLGSRVAFPASGRSTYRGEGSAVMYGDGKVLVISGAPNGVDPPTKTAEVIDLNSADPQWRVLQHELAFPRKYATPTLLPDGSVLLTGGTTSGGFNNAAGSVYPAEMWNPTTESWTTLAPMEVRRIYHSTAILLRDGRVLVTGGGQPAPEGYGNNLNAQLFSPPYLFRGPRPAMTSAPARVHYGQTFPLATPDGASITAVNWIRLSSVTHTFNQNQRINRLDFSQTSTGLSVTAPAAANVCPPGHYMLFILNSDGVPSVAAIVEIMPAFTDESVMSGSTVIRAIHITELRQRIDEVRKQLDLPGYSWTDPALTEGATFVRAVHITDLRTALAQAYDAASRPRPTYVTDPDLNAGTIIKWAHIAELRAAIVAIE